MVRSVASNAADNIYCTTLAHRFVVEDHTATTSGDFYLLNMTTSVDFCLLNMFPSLPSSCLGSERTRQQTPSVFLAHCRSSPNV